MASSKSPEVWVISSLKISKRRSKGVLTFGTYWLKVRPEELSLKFIIYKINEN
jgi:hypothetical protein